jgi:glycopeptide antibiotics resistance protein
VRSALRTAYAGYLGCVAYLVFSPGGGTPGGIIAWLHDLLASPSVGQIEVSLNVVMFVPLSLLGGVVLGRRGVAFWLVTGAVASTVIEVVQLAIPGRVSSVQDVVANTSGAVIGAVFALAWARWGTSSR